MAIVRPMKKGCPSDEKTETGGFLIVPTGLVVWSTGNKASPLNETLTALQRDKKDSFVVTEDLQVMEKSDVEGQRGELIPDVWAMGDCAQIEGHPLPATAQVSRDGTCAQRLSRTHISAI